MEGRDRFSLTPSPPVRWRLSLDLGSFLWRSESLSDIGSKLADTSWYGSCTGCEKWNLAKRSMCKLDDVLVLVFARLFWVLNEMATKDASFLAVIVVASGS